jgi:hypothetical protein
MCCERDLAYLLRFAEPALVVLAAFVYVFLKVRLHP